MAGRRRQGTADNDQVRDSVAVGLRGNEGGGGLGTWTWDAWCGDGLQGALFQHYFKCEHDTVGARGEGTPVVSS